MQRTWKPLVAGILAIVSGCMNFLAAFAVMLFMYAPVMHRGIPNPVIIAVPFLVLGIVAIVGGANALQRRRWGLALAGCICAIFSPWALLGILATVFVAIARDEFGTSSY